jgi:hypothetical protein
MKKLMLLACGLLIALTHAKLSAQIFENETPSYSDTLSIKLQDGARILITGAHFADLIDYKQADSLKMLFLSDYDRAVSDQSISANASLIHYFVHKKGTRRLKAEAADYIDNNIDITYEIVRLNLDLPKYQYHIHDLIRGYTIQIYVANPDQLKTVLSSVSITDAIHELGKDKDVYKKNYKVEFTNENQGFKLTNKAKRGFDDLWITPCFGAGILGDAVVPSFSAEFMIQLNNKYSIGEYKFGFTLTALPTVITANGEVQKVNYTNSYNLRFLQNLSDKTRRKETWFGLEVGLVRSDIGSYNGAIMLNAVYEPKGPFTYSMGGIIVNKHLGVPCFAVRMPF